MRKKFSVAILGNGRIGRAVRTYCAREGGFFRAFFPQREREVRNCDLLIGALPGGIGTQGLELALRYRKDLVDVSDVDPPDYLRKKRQIEQAGITVIPGCGFSPGFVNAVLGRELAASASVAAVEVKAGSLSPRAAFYPFLWCFEDIVLCHRLASRQITAGKRKYFPPFAGYQEEKFFGIDAESYFSASGFENLLGAAGARSATYRVVRPRGFMHFFRFLERQGFLKKTTMGITKRIVEAERQENLTFAEITVRNSRRSVTWLVEARARKNERLSSMQKITSSVPVVIARLIAQGVVRRQGVVFMEELARQEPVFAGLLAGASRAGILVRRKITEHG